MGETYTLNIITSQSLNEITKSGIPIFDELETAFLNKYAPCAFTGKDITEVLDDVHGRYEASELIFGTVARLDTVVQNAVQMESWIQSTIEKINPLFYALGLEEINWSKDYASLMHQIKTKGLKSLRLLTQGLKYTVEYRRDETSDERFLAVREKVEELFGPIPAFVFGSYLICANTGDIDVRIFPEEITVEMYDKLHKSKNEIDGTPLDLMITPQNEMMTFLLFDNWKSFIPSRSEVLRGPIRCPVPKSPEHYNNVMFADIALQGLRIRQALTPDGLLECEGILKRINSRIKKPKYMGANLELITGLKCPELKIEKFKEMPEPAEMQKRLLQSSLNFNKLIHTYAAELL